jgi:hypothetical protein
MSGTPTGIRSVELDLGGHRLIIARRIIASVRRHATCVRWHTRFLGESTQLVYDLDTWEDAVIGDIVDSDGPCFGPDTLVGLAIAATCWPDLASSGASASQGRKRL